MSKTVGRNDPRPCGSGKKYKRCCLPEDEDAARERARQPSMFAGGDFGEAAFDDEDGEAFNDVIAEVKQHRQQPGTCELCGAAVTRRAAQRHLADCAPAHDQRDGAEQPLVHLRATSLVSPAYWLDLEVRQDARLEAIDTFLRNIWLECCGHLSVFKMGTVEYYSRGYELNSWAGPVFATMGRQRPVERRMSARVGSALPSIGDTFGYEYDFGSTTSLKLKVMGARTGRPGRSLVRLLARNTPPFWPCAVCGEAATSVCPYCSYGEGNPFMCDKHETQHRCGESEGFLPVVNSPRMGVCGYSAET